MVNSENFSDRLQMLFDYYELTAGAFADEIEVGRPSVSHILSGRNKPSLDFVMKVVKRFREVDLYWLLNGKGNFPSGSQNPSTTVNNVLPNQTTTHLEEKSLPPVADAITQSDNSLPVSASPKKVSKVIVLYLDGSFEIFDKLHSL